jgi:hypothetical protein
VVSRIQFNDYDSVINSNTNAVEKVNAPKTFERLEEISTSAMRKKMEEDEDDDSDKIRITDDDIKLDDLGIFDFDNTGSDNKSPVVQDINFQLDIDELPPTNLIKFSNMCKNYKIVVYYVYTQSQSIPYRIRIHYLC